MAKQIERKRQAIATLKRDLIAAQAARQALTVQFINQRIQRHQKELKELEAWT